MNAQRKLRSISNFTQAGVGMGKHHVATEAEMFAESGHSCYSEGWAAGYLQAMQTVAKFVQDTLEDNNGE